MAKKGDRIIVTMACSECRERNYTTTKNRRNTTARIELKKYCKYERKHTLHREVK